MWLAQWYQPQTEQIVATHSATVHLQTNELQVQNTNALQCLIEPITKYAVNNGTRASELTSILLEVRRD